MQYLDLYNYLKSIENYTDDKIAIDKNLVMRNFTFISKQQI